MSIKLICRICKKDFTNLPTIYTQNDLEYLHSRAHACDITHKMYNFINKIVSSDLPIIYTQKAKSIIKEINEFENGIPVIEKINES